MRPWFSSGQAGYGRCPLQCYQWDRHRAWLKVVNVSRERGQHRDDVEIAGSTVVANNKEGDGIARLVTEHGPCVSGSGLKDWDWTGVEEAAASVEIMGDSRPKQDGGRIGGGADMNSNNNNELGSDEEKKKTHQGGLDWDAAGVRKSRW